MVAKRLGELRLVKEMERGMGQAVQDQGHERCKDVEASFSVALAVDSGSRSHLRQWPRARICLDLPNQEFQHASVKCLLVLST